MRMLRAVGGVLKPLSRLSPPFSLCVGSVGSASGCLSTGSSLPTADSMVVHLQHHIELLDLQRYLHTLVHSMVDVVQVQGQYLWWTVALNGGLVAGNTAFDLGCASGQCINSPPRTKSGNPRQ